MSSLPRHRSRRIHRPPERLSWPTGYHDMTTSSSSHDHRRGLIRGRSPPAAATPHSDDDVVYLGRRSVAFAASTTHSRKARRRTSASMSARVRVSGDARKLWCDRYAPVHTSDLAVHPKKVDEVRAALATIRRHGTNSVIFLVGPPGCGKSATVRAICNEMKTDVVEWNGGNDGAMMSGDSYFSEIEAFRAFLRGGAGGYGRLNVSEEFSQKSERGSHTRSRSRPSVLLIEELPNLHDVQSQENFRAILTDHASRGLTTGGMTPTIFIFSDVVSGGRANPTDLEKLVDPSVLYSPQHVAIIHFNAIAKTKMAAALERIARSEGMLWNKNRSEEMFESSRGDVRCAVMTMQFLHGGKGSKKGRSITSGSHVERSDGSFNRDLKLSSFHALGKLLYAKRLDSRAALGDVGRRQHFFIKHNSLHVSSYGDDGRPPLNFDPEEVIAGNDMSIDGIISFLSYHSPEFFSDITELSEAFEFFSDASFLFQKKFSGLYSGDRHFPDSYAESLASRSVAYANLHPAPFKFRSFGAPKLFEVMRNRKENHFYLNRMRIRPILGEVEEGRTNVFDGPFDDFLLDRLPFMKKIAPYETNQALKSLHSYAMASENKTRPTAIFGAKLSPVQGNSGHVLSDDDIVDDDD